MSDARLDRHEARADIGLRIGLCVCAALSVSLVAWLLWRCRQGFEFTDEGYYLAWIAEPFLYPHSASQFGFVYHPLHRLFGGDIALLRQANLLLTFMPAWGMFVALFSLPLRSAAIPAWPRVQVWTLSAGLASSALILYSNWLVTPNYNGLALQAMLLTACGMALTQHPRARAPLAGWLVLGVGGALAFLAKPTTAASLAVLCGAVMLGARALTLRGLALSIATAFAVVIGAALCIDGGLPGFAARLAGGAEIMQAFDGGYAVMQLLRLDDFYLTPTEKRGLELLFALTLISTLLAATRHRVAMAIAQWSSILLGVAALALIAGFEPHWPTPSAFVSLLLVSVAGAGALASLLLWRRREGHGLTRVHAGYAAALAIFPAAYAFGSNNNYWLPAANAGVFWVAAGALLLLPRVASSGNATALLPLAIGTQVVTVALFAIGMHQPYRQPGPLASQDRAVELGAEAATLRLAPSFADYLESLQRAARAEGFTPGTPMLDLSGQSPGVLYALGARQIGLPWWAGGSAGSDALARLTAARLSCAELTASWLLLEPAGPRALSTDFLMRLGARPDRDYVLVARVPVPTGAGGYTEPREQRLLRPSRPPMEANAACENARRAGPEANPPRTSDTASG